ncbi:hypothetical protein KBY93_09270 [Synechococcus sp. J7-Johnson]|nr:hypothetical protein [Synechococcus sp. J7-Johnson]
MVIPPPNVTGSLHMGHGFETALIDTPATARPLITMGPLRHPSDGFRRGLRCPPSEAGSAPRLPLRGRRAPGSGGTAGQPRRRGGLSLRPACPVRALPGRCKPRRICRHGDLPARELRFDGRRLSRTGACCDRARAGR